MSNQKANHRFCAATASFFVGGLIGAAVAILFAPKAGSETRQQIRGLAEDVKGKVGDYYEQVRETVTSALKQGKGLFEDKKQRITNAVQAGIEAYEDKR